MKNIFISLCLTLLLLIGSYFVYAYFFEGEKVNEIYIREENRKIALQEQKEEKQKIAQGLKVGRYVVWSQQSKNKDGSSVVSLWRYFLPKGKSESFFSISLTRGERVYFDKFSDESLSVFIYDDDQLKGPGKLVHLNGRVLGPAERYPGRISPDRRWVIWWNSDDRVLYLRDVAVNKVTALKQGEFVLSGWSPDSRFFYWSGREKDKAIIWRYDVVSKEINFVSAGKEFKEVKIYPLLAKALGKDDNSLLWLIDLKSGSLQKLAGSKDNAMVEFYLSATGKSFAYSLEGGKYILQSLGKEGAEKSLDFSKLYAWPDDNLLVIKEKRGLSVFFINEDKSKLLSTSSEKEVNTWTDFDFIGIFDIR